MDLAEVLDGANGHHQVLRAQLERVLLTASGGVGAVSNVGDLAREVDDWERLDGSVNVARVADEVTARLIGESAEVVQLSAAGDGQVLNGGLGDGNLQIIEGDLGKLVPEAEHGVVEGDLVANVVAHNSEAVVVGHEAQSQKHDECHEDRGAKRTEG